MIFGNIFCGGLPAYWEARLGWRLERKERRIEEMRVDGDMPGDDSTSTVKR
jgi:hypothetical protein